LNEESKGEAGSPLAPKLSGAVALIATLFGVMGFLCTRAYVSGLGIPEHANISADNYVQYGGRLFFVLAVDLLPIGFCLLLLSTLSGAVLHRWDWLRRSWESGSLPLVALAVVAAVTIALELRSLGTEPVFSLGRLRHPEISQDLRSQLYAIELGAAVTLLLLAGKRRQLKRRFRNAVALGPLIAFALLLAAIVLLLFPLSFGRIAMTPREFSRVTLQREKDQVPLGGILVFSDAESYFVWNDQRKLVEAPHRTVKEIQYDSVQRLEDLANR
jgi:hypothetical protein